MLRHLWLVVMFAGAVTLSSNSSRAPAHAQEPRDVPAQEPPSRSPPPLADPADPNHTPSGGPGADENPDPAAVAKARPVDVSWQNGFLLRTNDGAFTLRILGIVQADAVGYLDKQNHQNYDDLYIRRARLYVEGRSFRFVEYRLMTEFGREGPTVLDGFADIHFLGDAIRFRGGKFKQPFSYEQFVMEDRTLVVFERSLIDQLTPARNVGFMLHGDLAGVFRYAVSVANGTRDGDDDDARRNSKDVVGRVESSPFTHSENAALKYLVMGYSIQWGKETDKWNPGTLKTPLGVQWFQFNANVANSGTRLRMGPEFYYFAGPFGMGGQYLYQTQQVRAEGAPNATVRFDGGFALASLVVTGEARKNYAMFIDPYRHFDPRDPLHRYGALELLVRVSALRVGGDAFKSRYALVDPNQVASGVTELSVGANWYLNRYTWLMFDYERDWYRSALSLGGGPRLRTSNEIGGRLTVLW